MHIIIAENAGCISFSILIVFYLMLSAIHFNNNAVFKVHKINYVIVYELLPPEF